MKPGRERLIIGLIALGGLALRLRNAGDIPLTADEAFDYSIAGVRGLTGSLGAIAKFNANPPLNFIIEHFWSMLGDSELMLRLPSVLFGVLTILAVYRLAKSAHGGTAGIWAALLFAVSPLDVYFSQEARMYSLQVLLCAVSTWLLLECVKTGKRWNLYILSALAAMYTHYFSVFVVLAQQAFLLARVIYHGKEDLRMFLKANAILFIFSVPLLFLGNAQARAIRELRFMMFNGPPPGFAELFTGINQMFSGIYSNHPGFFIQTSPFTIFTALLLVACAWACLQRVAKNGWDDGMVLLPAAFLLPVIVPVIIAQFKPFFMNTHLIIALPAMIALIATGITILLPSAGAWAVAIFLTATMMMNSLSTTSRQSSLQWRQVTEILMRESGPGDVVGAYSTYYLTLAGYYSKRMEKEMPRYRGKKIQVAVFQPLRKKASEEEQLKAVEKKMEEVRKRYGRLWLLVTVDERERDQKGVLRKYLDSREQKVREYQTSPALVLYELKGK